MRFREDGQPHSGMPVGASVFKAMSGKQDQMKQTCVLAYSGGLDTSVLLGWLIEKDYDVIAVYVDLGQPCEDREAILAKAASAAPK